MKNSPTWKIFNYYIFQLNELPLMNQLRKQYESPPQDCPDQSGSPITWTGCFSAFIMLGGGGILALTIILLELVIRYISDSCIE